MFGFTCWTANVCMQGHRTAAEGASTATFLATAPVEELRRVCAPGPITGRFFFNTAPLLTFEAEWAGPVAEPHKSVWA